MSDPKRPVIAEYDNPRLYAGAAELRQLKDAAWVLGLLPARSFRRCLDLGCGNGELLLQLAEAGRVVEGMTGIDRSEAMIVSARAKLSGASPKVPATLITGDLLAPPPIEGSFDLVTMLAVQHWLYPQEADVYRWISARLETEGYFSLTSYHPAVDHNSVGGSDEVVLEAMRMIDAAAAFPAGFLPIGRRARPAVELIPLLERHFHVVAMEKREAVTRTETAEQYAGFHEATFGSYYAGMLPESQRAWFFEAVGQAAMLRMERLGFVTSMAVHCWICEPKA